ncbi:MAG: peptide ABC transporter substrate-binding protein, partial [Kiloniellales bacterium]|nr:peptide ABC transporter substrate-binding protein [Kiloniellales bacterium]
VTYKIHPEATWGDGTPVTTKDVILAWEVGKHPLSGVATGEPFRRVLSIDTPDDKTYTVHVDRVTYNYNLNYAIGVLPAHIERPIFESGPAEYRNRTAFDTDPTNPGLYFGPYRIAEVVKGSHIALEPNSTWWGEAPAFERITVRTIENTPALEANLLSGSIDMIAGELGLNIDQALAFEKRNGDDYQVIYKPGLVYEHIDLQLENPVLQDVRIRRALMHAIDRQAISDRLFGGKQPPAHKSVSPLDSVHSEDVRRYDHDPAKAAALLDEAGWAEIRDGIRHDAAGEPLVLEFMTTAGNRTRELVQQVLQSQWKQVGIDVRIRNEPARVYFGETLNQRKHKALAMFAWISSPENVPRTTLHSEEIPTEANGWSGQNYTAYSNSEMDDLLDRIERELDFDRRKALWARLQQIYAEDLPVLPLYWRANTYVLPKWLEGVRPTGHQFTSTLWVEEWRRGAR